MTSDHTPFDSLAGAIALGEASPVERAEFAAHAADCALCRDDGVAALTAVRDRMIAAREEETWRPAVASVLMTRIRNDRLQRSRVTLRVLTWSVAFSIALDAAFVSGGTSYAERALQTTGTTMVNALVSYRTALR